MADSRFEKQDQEFMDRLKAERERPVAPEILRGFSERVESRIQAKTSRKVRPVWVTVAMPMAAVLLLASWVVLKNPSLEAPSVRPYMNVMLAGTSDLAEEIAAFQELGLWSDEDDQETLGVSDLDVVAE